MNRYLYVLNSPTNLIDPLGLNESDCRDDFFAGSHAECSGIGRIGGGIGIGIGIGGGGGGGGGGGVGTGGTGSGGSGSPPSPAGIEDFPNGESLGFPSSMPLRMPTLADLLIPGGAQACHFGPCVQPMGVLPAVILVGGRCLINAPCRQLVIVGVHVAAAATGYAVGYYLNQWEVRANQRAYEQDKNVCRSLANPAAKSRCWESAEKRRWARENGREMPPLITW